jgi:hypothetical protein
MAIQNNKQQVRQTNLCQQLEKFSTNGRGWGRHTDCAGTIVCLVL